MFVSLAENIKAPEPSLVGWMKIQRCLPRIVEYGITEGIIQNRDSSAFNITGMVVANQEEQQTINERKKEDKVNLPTNDITLMHEALPFLPVPVALICCASNVLLPGSGTILSGFSVLCMGQPRINFKEARKLISLLINILVGISQFFTIPFLFVGWFWSIAWGGLIIIHSLQYREALQQRRQEAVATAAIEALTKDSILHRRDVKTLVKNAKTGTIYFD
uniref:Protein SPEC3 n=1 Tax=Rhabditophanes sp. KR3021 TaxID=114890 RepID=A0AC35TRK1_9BILA